MRVLGFLKSHLSGDLFTWMRIANPAGIDAFFTELKNMWLERIPNLNVGQNYQNSSSTEIDKLDAKIASLEAQLAQAQAQPQNNDALDRMHVLAGRLGIPLDAPKDASYLDKYITDELIKRLGVVEIHLAKLSKEGTRDTESLDPNILGNDGVDKRLGLIETHLAKLTRRDSRNTKSF